MKESDDEDKTKLTYRTLILTLLTIYLQNVETLEVEDVHNSLVISKLSNNTLLNQSYSFIHKIDLKHINANLKEIISRINRYQHKCHLQQADTLNEIIFLANLTTLRLENLQNVKIRNKRLK
ncbi:hypothetical protein NQ314_006325 [Rhamnusium bicolor]|uniref:Uncharacterized protein n=1 Tax=Rhamnusium bicolor TaxID=1586634 RepID=A0AAV8Z4C9_9CUCU|nr:hypothetical protein NQ314_006325 [Rhamnusium bicolor]